MTNNNLYSDFNSKNFIEEFFYGNNDLGITYSKKATTFKVWAPLAERVTLMLYSSGDISDKSKGLGHLMENSINGTFTITINGDLDGKFYTYVVKNKNSEEQEAGDPYAIAVGVNGDRSAVIDITKTNPTGWLNDSRPALENMTDSIIYELHMRDLSTCSSSGIKNVGKFIQFTEDTPSAPSGCSRGINHIKELGITAVHLLPCFDYSTINEKTLWKNDFNWGYDPKNYNVPEGSYSTNPYNPYTRIIEFKEMVQALHNNGIRIILDVVYNHTVDNIESKFHKLVPNYYYRMNEDGSFCNGSYCDSETASERPMMRKYIVDSVIYWAREYHIDGFRFDLMGLHDIETMNLVRRELSKVDKSIQIYGEGWDMGNLPRAMRAIQPFADKLPGIGMFNDNVRDNLKGSFDDVHSHGYIDGKQNLELEIMKCVVGSIEYNEVIKDYNAKPEQSINYVEAHDNNTLWDKLQLANPKLSEIELARLDMFAASILFTSQGVPFIAAGQEFLRTKHGNENSFRSPDHINMLDWNRKEKFINVYTFYKNLIILRKEHPAFRMNDILDIKSHISFLSSYKNVITYVIKDHANRDNWKNIIVIHNSNDTTQSITIPDARWNVVVKDCIASSSAIESFSGGNTLISAKSSIIMYTDDDIVCTDLFYKKRILKTTIGNNEIKINHNKVKITEPMVLINDMIYIPIIEFSKAVGCSIATHNNITKIVTNNNHQILISSDSVTIDETILKDDSPDITLKPLAMISLNMAKELLKVSILVDYKRYEINSHEKLDINKPDVYIIF